VTGGEQIELALHPEGYGQMAIRPGLRSALTAAAQPSIL